MNNASRRDGQRPSPALRWPVLPQSQRRIAVVMTYAGLATTVALLWGRASGDLPGWSIWLAALGAIVAVAGFGGISATATRATWWRAPLDERDQAVRDHAYRRSYWVVTCLTLLALLYAMLAADRPGWWMPSRQEHYWSLFVVLALVAGSLPTAIVAWIEPDMTADSIA